MNTKKTNASSPQFLMNQHMVDARIRIVKDSITIVEKSIALKAGEKNSIKGKIILQMLGSGLVLYVQNNGLPKPVVAM